MSSRPRAVALTILTVFALTLTMPGPGAEATPDAAEPRVIEVVAKRYAFEPAVIDVAVGESIRLMVRSADGVHGFQIKQLKIGKEIPRGGEAVVIDLTPTAAGRFPILCSEYCGDGHGGMKGTLVVAAQAP